MLSAEGGWVEGRQRSSFSQVLQRKGKILGGSGQNGVCGRLVSVTPPDILQLHP